MPAGRTYTPIARQTVSAVTGTVTFSSIPNTYTDLILVWAGTTTTGVEARLRFNGDTNTNYSYTYFGADGTSTYANRGTNQNLMYITTYGTPSTTQGNFILHIQNYANTNTYKTVIARGNRITSGFGPDATAGSWRSTAAINQIDLLAGSTTWAIGSTFTLYGILAA